MNKIDEFEMGEKIFGYRTKFDEWGDSVLYSKADLWNKLVEFQNQIRNLERENQRLKEENENLDHWEKTWNGISKEMDESIQMINKALVNPFVEITDYKKWASDTLEQLEQLQNQLVIKVLEELRKDFDYCPYSGDKIYLAEVCDKIDNQIKKLKGESDGQNIS